jgi:hypothetical protein
VQGETIKMRRDEAVMPAMSQEECIVRRIQEGFQMEAIRGDDVHKQACAFEVKTKYGSLLIHMAYADGLQIP